MKVEKVKIGEVKNNPQNPRLIKDDKFRKLVKSIFEFPQMLELRPIVVDENNIVLGGNMRLKACKEAGLKDVFIVKAENLTEEQKQEFIVKDNVGFGEWDWDMLANEWDVDKLDEWGLNLPVDFSVADELEAEQDDLYTKKVEAPIYEPSEEKPKYLETYDKSKFNELINKIESSALEKDEKELLKLYATRHIVFNYQKIADLYAHSNTEMQNLMEDSALVIIDFEKAIELGYVKLSEEISEQYGNEYGDE